MKTTIDAQFFKSYFGLRQQYCGFLSAMLQAILVAETVCLSRLCLHLGYAKKN
jgi:hypothetical protein